MTTTLVPYMGAVQDDESDDEEHEEPTPVILFMFLQLLRWFEEGLYDKIEDMAHEVYGEFFLYTYFIPETGCTGGDGDGGLRIVYESQVDYSEDPIRIDVEQEHYYIHVDTSSGGCCSGCFYVSLGSEEYHTHVLTYSDIVSLISSFELGDQTYKPILESHLHFEVEPSEYYTW